MEDSPEPQTVEQAETTRRKFLKWLLGSIAVVNGLIVFVPFLKALADSSLRAQKKEWSKVADMGLLPQGKPVNVRFQSESEDAYFHNKVLHSVWVIRHSPSEVTVFSPICTHLGCYYLWDPQTGHFECPCHASVFALDGRVLGGPAPRPLDTLPVKVDNGTVLVQWERFRVGIPQKITV
ncbi:MAG: ubiquinol-cytochrome c reductase iron-sulfur subunit [Nitrospirae bacterium]|nr:ubiquinol-cytochrome c reductase iron-sulfur subunit [Nitrospirota bacterium]MCL5238215.1 ubiquinol-cytochrome c reductase iron-sulfur subunit [Nitrospirota bacterium]